MNIIKSIFPSCITPKFSQDYEAISVNVHFWFCSTAESIGQDSAILPDDQPIKLQESKAG